MPRYIDADALREEINSLSVTLCGKELFGELAKHSVLQKIDEAPTADVTDINDGHKSAWISVDDRLPEPWKDVMTYDGFFMGVDFIYNDGTWSKQQRRIIRPITHWMPLSEPPITDKPTQEQ